MTNRSTGFWQALEAVPGAAAVDAEWKVRFGSDYATAKAFLRPNGKLASSHPCLVQLGCGCEHEVVVHDPEDIVAVCRCERGCETFALQRSDIVVYELDRSALDTALAKVFGLIEETDAGTDLPGTTRIGVYSPYAGYRFPVYLAIQIEPEEFGTIVDGLLSRNDSPFILLAPTRTLCTVKTEKQLTARRSAFLPLTEAVRFDASRQIQLLHPLPQILNQFRAANLPSPEETNSKTFFPTPPDATWEDVSMRFTDGYSLFIRVKTASGRFECSQMGMINRKNSKRTKQWMLLMAFAESRGEIDWKNINAHPNLKKQKQELAKSLKEFFQLKDDPIEWDKGSKAYRCRFQILPEGGGDV